LLFHPSMKKILSLCAFLFLISVLSFAQKDKKLVALPKIPVDSLTHLITYEEVVPIKKDLSAEIIYQRALAWFRKYYKNFGEVVRENDMTNHIITGKPRFKIYNPADKEGTKTDAGLVQYTITISAREGRFKYEITGFNWKQTSYYPSERWMDTSASSYAKVYDEYLRQLDEYTRALIADLKSSMTSEKPIKDKDNW
jgi:hypothetical protein